MRTRISAPLVVGAVLAVLTAAPALAAVATSPAPSSTVVGPVLHSVQAGDRLYIGGSFTRVDGSPHAGLAAISATTGVRDPGFRVDVNGTVHALATDGTNIYIGGTFTTVGGVARTNLAAVTPSGQVLSGFNPRPSSTVESLAFAQDGTLYVGGAFKAIAGVNRPFLAALDAATGTLRTAFDPRPNALVHVVTASGGQVYVGGKFTTIDGVGRSYVALLDAAGAVQPYNPRLAFDSQVFDVVSTDAGVYLATGGHLPAGNSVYATAPETGDQRWQQSFDGDVEAVEVVGADVYAGGHFNYVCFAATRTTCQIDFSSRKAAVMDAVTGQARRFATFDSAHGIRDLTTAGGNLFVGGEFTQVNGSNQAGVARFPIS
ncbi:MAG: PQQ-binding-like beta-propeller repeat protein [Knoellia sp.]